MDFGLTDLAILAGVVAVVIGVTRLPKIVRSLHLASREFRARMVESPPDRPVESPPDRPLHRS